MKRFWLRRGLRFLAFAICFIGLAGLITKSLWNALLPDILGAKAINFWQALGLLALSRLLFRGFRGPWGRPGFGGNDYGKRGRWKEKMAERWQHLTPQQRDAMRQKWGDRCQKRPSPTSTQPAPDTTTSATDSTTSEPML